MTSNSFLSDEATHSFDDDVMDGMPLGEEQEEEQKLSWRLDPVESHSDWTLLVLHGDVTNTYHVHKNILAVGPCRSDYFVSVFRSTHLAESQNNTSQIVLEEPAARAMPIMLDFIYDIPAHRLEISTQHVVALRYLAKYFGIRIMYRKVMEYLKKDMSLDNLSTYIAGAAVFHDETALSLAATKCLDNLQFMNDTLMEQMDPTFFLRILSNPDVDTCSVSCQMSTLLAEYCQIHREELTKELFEQLTDRKHIPQIDRDAAVPLLELEVDICGDKQTDSNVPSSSCLQKRCIKVLALHWKDFAEPDKMPSSTLHKLPKAVLVELMEKTILVAKQNHHDMERSKLTDSMSLMEQVEELKREKAEREAAHRLELQQCQQEGRARANHLHSLMTEKDRQIAEYRREWGKMVRVPPEYNRFGDKRLSTFHHQAANEPFDANPSSNRVSRFGRIRPTAMPRIGESDEDGYLVVDTRKRWPVFYYKDE